MAPMSGDPGGYASAAGKLVTTLRMSPTHVGGQLKYEALAGGHSPPAIRYSSSETALVGCLPPACEERDQPDDRHPEDQR